MMIHDIPARYQVPSQKLCFSVMGSFTLNRVGDGHIVKARKSIPNLE